MEWLKSINDPETADQIAAATDAEVVRRRFDRSNVPWALFLSAGALLAAVIQTGMSLSRETAPVHWFPIALSHWVVAISAFVILLSLTFARNRVRRPWLPVQVVARNPTAWILGFLLLEFVLLSAFRVPGSDAWQPWAIVYPWALVPLRLHLSRHLFLSLSLLVVTVLNVLLLGADAGALVARLVPAGLSIIVTFAIGAFLSRRLRRQTIREWTHRREQAREQVRMREELRYARELQLSMLPEESPSIAWLDLAGASSPASEVGGDYYDYFVDEGAVTVVCADVAGHGLSSGIVLAALRGGFTLLREMLGNPASVLQRLSDMVAQTSRRRMLATAAVVRFDVEAGRATIASAGHPPVMYCRAGVTRVIELFAPPLGVRLPFRVPSTEIELIAGDVWVLHSDGVYEAANPSGEMYGLDRLAVLISDHAESSAAEIRDLVVQDVVRFREGAAQQDDVTVVVARVL